MDGLNLKRKSLGFLISVLGLILLLVGALYPLGYLESEFIFNSLKILGALLILVGIIIRTKAKTK